MSSLAEAALKFFLTSMSALANLIKKHDTTPVHKYGRGNSNPLFMSPHAFGFLRFSLKFCVGLLE